MLKQTVNYTDFDDQPAVETVYFNLTKSDLADNMHLIEDFEVVRTMLSGKKRDLKPTEIQLVINMVKAIMRMSYGVRSEDGKRFIKTDQQWTEFTQTAVYDEFLMSLFADPKNALEFVSNVIPKDYRDAVLAEAKKVNEELSARDISTPTTQTVVAPSEPVTIIQEEPAPFRPAELTPEQRAAAEQDYMRRNGLS